MSIGVESNGSQTTNNESNKRTTNKTNRDRDRDRDRDKDGTERENDVKECEEMCLMYDCELGESNGGAIRHVSVGRCEPSGFTAVEEYRYEEGRENENENETRARSECGSERVSRGCVLLPHMCALRACVKTCLHVRQVVECSPPNALKEKERQQKGGQQRRVCEGWTSRLCCHVCGRSAQEPCACE